MTEAKHILLIAGGGQNVGKTTLVCQLIRRFAAHHHVVAVKMSSHMHEIDDGVDYIAKTDDYAIVRETIVNMEKDSSKMLNAGANEVFYIQTKPHALAGIVPDIMGLIDDRLCICESGGLRQNIKPAVFIYLTNGEKKEKDLLKSDADIVLSDFEFSKLKIEVKNNTWKLF